MIFALQCGASSSRRRRGQRRGRRLWRFGARGRASGGKQGAIFDAEDLNADAFPNKRVALEVIDKRDPMNQHYYAIAIEATI